MEERLERDLTRWKDRVELSLDGRQVFLLFFGCALAACLVFVLGVMVGQRLEARTRAEAAAAKVDPLALLDQFDDGPDEGSGKNASGERKSTREAARGDSTRETAVPVALTPRARKDELTDAPKVPSEAKPEHAKPESTKPEPAKAPSPKPELAKPEPAKPDPALAKTNSPPARAESPNREARPQEEPKDKTDKEAKDAKGGKYTLQLSSFPDKAEAESFARRFDGSGLKVSIFPAQLPGKGTWWRVRAGASHPRRLRSMPRRRSKRSTRSLPTSLASARALPICVDPAS